VLSNATYVAIADPHSAMEIDCQIVLSLPGALFMPTLSCVKSSGIRKH
jgi:hypothetical protein